MHCGSKKESEMGIRAGVWSREAWGWGCSLPAWTLSPRKHASSLATRDTLKTLRAHQFGTYCSVCRWHWLSLGSRLSHRPAYMDLAAWSHFSIIGNQAPIITPRHQNWPPAPQLHPTQVPGIPQPTRLLRGSGQSLWRWELENKKTVSKWARRRTI